jgi:hypothetical protein
MPFEIALMNDLHRLHLVSDEVDGLLKLSQTASDVKQAKREELNEHRQ